MEGVAGTLYNNTDHLLYALYQYNQRVFGIRFEDLLKDQDDDGSILVVEILNLSR